MLHLASGHKQLVVARYLVESRANVNAANHRGRTPLDIAVPARQQAIIQFLQDHGAENNIPAAQQNNRWHLPALKRRRRSL